MRTVVLAVILSCVATVAYGQQCQRCGRVISQSVSYGGNVVAAWGSGAKLERALRSAQYRAARGISGHCYVERGTNSGVGYAWGRNADRTPATCYGATDSVIRWRVSRGGAYASVRGRNGAYYSTLIL